MEVKASIIIPSYNGRSLLEKNLPQVITNSPDCEIIVVDDASTDQSQAFLAKEFPQVMCIANRVNQRFVNSVNRGVAKAKAHIVILLNNDVIPEPGYLEPLLTPFENDWVFAVGCREIDDDGQVSGRSGGEYARGVIRHWRCSDQAATSSFWVSGGSGAFRKSMWKQLGGMDEIYKPAYQEDRDICYRALKRGWLVQFAPTSLVHHHHETTNKQALGEKQMEIASYKNLLLFIWKNITSTRLFCSHIVWLPYHLVFTSFKSQGRFLLGFLAAIKQIPQVYSKRKVEKLDSTHTDESILYEAKRYL